MATDTERLSTSMWDPQAETLPRSSIEQLQGELLREQVNHVYYNSEFFRKRFEDAHIHPKDICSYEDIVNIPTFTKEDLRETRNKTGDPFAGTLCVPMSQLSIVTHSSGTSGTPNVYGMTREDYDLAADVFARSSFTIGLRPGDQVIVPGGLRWHGTIMSWDHAFEKMGITRYYAGNSTQDVVKETLETFPDATRINSIFVYQPEVEVGYIKAKHLDVKQMFPNLKVLWSAVDTSPLRKKLWEETWGVPFRNQYGSGDQFWMTGECPANSYWVHAPEDYFLFEVLDPETLQPVPPGGTGMLFITNLRMKGTPYVRYCMEDMVQYEIGRCDCGRTSMRLHIRGRFAWSLKVNGNYIFSQEVENAIWSVPRATGANYQLVRMGQDQDKLIVRIALPEGDNEPGLKDEIEESLTTSLHVPAEVRFVDQSAIQVKGIKMLRVVGPDMT